MLTAEIEQVVETALVEDVGSGDRTTEAVVAADARCEAVLLLEEPGVVCGIPVAAAVFARLDPGGRVEALFEDGAVVLEAPAPLARITGPARAVLTGERTALNFVARLSGVATLTRRYVELVDGTAATILDTRKTTPGLRALERYAVRCGGGRNHRFGLDDAVLVKENHLRLGGGIATAAAAVRTHAPELSSELEAETLDQVREALDAGVTRILLDNMTAAEVAGAVELVAGAVELEASGGISLATVRAYAETGVDFISVGALTHSACSLHVSLEVR